MPSSAHRRTSSKPGPTMRTRWPPLTRVQVVLDLAAVRRRYRRQAHGPADPTSLRRPRAARRGRRDSTSSAPSSSISRARPRRSAPCSCQRTGAPPSPARPNRRHSLTDPGRRRRRAAVRARRAAARAPRRRAAARSMGRPSSVSIDVARSAISGGYAAVPQVDADADDDGVDVRTRPRRTSHSRPPSFRHGRPMTRSFGHFSSSGRPVVAATASAAATPAASVKSGSVRADSPGRTTTDRYSPAPGGENHVAPAAAAAGALRVGQHRRALRRAGVAPAPARRRWSNRPRRSTAAARTAPSRGAAAASASDQIRRQRIGHGDCRHAHARSSFDLQADVRRRRGVRERADRDVVGAEGGDAADAVERDAAGDLDVRPAGDARNASRISSSSRLSSMMMSAPAASAASTSVEALRLDFDRPGRAPVARTRATRPRRCRRRAGCDCP